MKNICLIAIVLFLFSCSSSDDFVTESGVEVSCLVKGDGEGLMKDSIAVMYVKIVTQEEEEKVILETTSDRPMPLAFDPEMEGGHVQDVIRELEVGDSVVFETTIRNIYEETFNSPMSPELDPEGMVTVSIKLIKQLSQGGWQAYASELQNQARQKEMASLEEKAASDGETIDSFLDSLGIDATTTDSGLRYIITEEGNGPTAEPGDSITVHYDGTLLNGDPFDSSRDRGEPFTFVVGRGRVIPGWDEGIPYIKEGGKGKLYIPSPLAYGARSPSPAIPAYSILVFDVEVIEVKK